PTIEIPSESLLLRSGLGVEIDHDHLGLFADSLDRGIPDGEWAIQRGHEDAALHVQHAHANSAPRVSDEDSGSRSRRRIVMRAQQPGLLVEVGNNGALVPDMVS